MIDEIIEGFEQTAKDLPEDQKEWMNGLISELKALSGDGAKSNHMRLAQTSSL